MKNSISASSASGPAEGGCEAERGGRRDFSTRELLEFHSRRYPQMQVQDVIKLLYQSEFGGGHMIADEGKSLQWLEKECLGLESAADEGAETIGGGLIRLHLASLLGKGIHLSTVNRFFVNTAKENRGTVAGFAGKLEIFRECCREKLFCFSMKEAEDFLWEYQRQGCPSVHHSNIYKALYAPAYRVVKAEYGKFLPVFSEIDRRRSKMGTLLVAIDGNCAAGKSTLASLLKTVYDCNVIPMDDFFLPLALKTPARLREPGGNIDYARFYNEITAGLKSGRTFVYRAYDCFEEKLGGYISVPQKPLNIIEGVYSLHPLLAGAYGLKIFLGVEEEEQRARIRKRNSPELQRCFFQEWIPMEETYFRTFSIPQTCDLVLKG